MTLVEALMQEGEVRDRLADLLHPPPWHLDAACREHPELDYFAGQGGNASTAAAKAVCASCLVRDVCLAYALEHEEHGVWGATSAKDRQALRRARTAA